MQAAVKPTSFENFGALMYLEISNMNKNGNLQSWDEPNTDSIHS